MNRTPIMDFKLEISPVLAEHNKARARTMMQLREDMQVFDSLEITDRIKDMQVFDSLEITDRIKDIKPRPRLRSLDDDWIA